MTRFWNKINKTKNCWEWTAAITTGGYGFFWFNGKNHYAHRISWIMNKGTIPDNLCVLHKCDNRKCVKPSHLFLGTQEDNAKDMASKGRANRPIGEKNASRKLTWMQVAEIRRLHIPRRITFKMLAKRFKVSKETIQNIITNQSWVLLKRTDG